MRAGAQAPVFNHDDTFGNCQYHYPCAMPLFIYGGVAMRPFFTFLIFCFFGGFLNNLYADTATIWKAGPDCVGASAQAVFAKCPGYADGGHILMRPAYGSAWVRENCYAAFYKNSEGILVENNNRLYICPEKKSCDTSTINKKWQPTKSYGFGLFDLHCHDNCLIGRGLDVIGQNLNDLLIQNNFNYNYQGTGKVCNPLNGNGFELFSDDEDPAVYLRCPSGKGHFLEGTNPTNECLGTNNPEEIPTDVYYPCPDNMGSYKKGQDPTKACKTKQKNDNSTQSDDESKDDDDGKANNNNRAGAGGTGGAENGSGNAVGQSGAGNDDTSGGGGGSTDADGSQNNSSGGGDHGDTDTGLRCPSGKGSYKRGTEPSGECAGESDGGSGTDTGDGEAGEGGAGDKGGQGSISGGNCAADQAPQCKGDPIQCYIAVEQWRTACAATGQGSAVKGTDCKANFECKGDAVHCFTARMARDAKCARDDIANAADALKNMDLGGITTDSKQPTSGDLKKSFAKEENLSNFKGFDASGFLSVKQCMPSSKFVVKGKTIEIDWHYWCLFLQYCSYFVMAVGYLLGLRIFTAAF